MCVTRGVWVRDGERAELGGGVSEWIFNKINALGFSVNEICGEWWARTCKSAFFVNISVRLCMFMHIYASSAVYRLGLQWKSMEKGFGKTNKLIILITNIDIFKQVLRKTLGLYIQLPSFLTRFCFTLVCILCFAAIIPFSPSRKWYARPVRFVFRDESLPLQHCSASTHTHPHTELTQHCRSSRDWGETETSGQAQAAQPELCFCLFQCLTQLCPLPEAPDPSSASWVWPRSCFQFRDKASIKWNRLKQVWN